MGNKGLQVFPISPNRQAPREQHSMETHNRTQEQQVTEILPFIFFIAMLITMVILTLTL